MCPCLQACTIVNGTRVFFSLRCSDKLLDLICFLHELQTPRIVSLLSESYNPHVRYGAALAVGISCAGTGLSEAISLLEPLTSDVVDFVRQGALIAMAMVMVQISEASDSRVGTFRYHSIADLLNFLAYILLLYG